jgi:hypothetical protein
MVVSDIDVPQRHLYGLENDRVAVTQVEHAAVEWQLNQRISSYRSVKVESPLSPMTVSNPTASKKSILPGFT